MQIRRVVATSALYEGDKIWYNIVTKRGIVTEMEAVTHSQIFDAWRESGTSATPAALWKRLRSLVKRGELIVVGRDSYIWARETNLRPYRPGISDMASQILREMEGRYGRMNYTLFELNWLNDFLSHLIARNALFVMVERNYAPFVFEFLTKLHVGNVMLDPSTDDFFRYAHECMVLVVKKPSQGPMNRVVSHVAPPEQWLADILADERLSISFEGAELPNIFSAFRDRYAVNKSALFRYAKRRGVYERVRNLLEGDVA